MKSRYVCRYLTPTGEVKNEVLDLYTEEDIKHYMEQNRFMLISFKPEASLIANFKSRLRRPLSNGELMDFCDQMYFVFDSGTSLIEGLQIIKDDNENKKVSEALNTIYEEVEKGNALSEAMKSTGNLFPELLIYMVESGEVSSNLTDIFKQMKMYYEKQGQVRQKIKAALIQPSILLLVGVVVTIYFLQVVLPDLMENLDIDHNQLPLVTKFLIFLSDSISNYYLYILLGIGLTIGFIIFLWQNDKVRYAGHKLIIKVPIVGKTIRYLETFRMSISLFLFLRSEVSILTALEVLEKILKNLVAKSSVADAREKLLEGGSLYDGFKIKGFFGNKFVKYVEIGEETGTLEGVMRNLSEYYKNKMDEVIDKSLKNLEPILTVVMAIVVGIVVAAIALPIFSMVDYIQ